MKPQELVNQICAGFLVSGKTYPGKLPESLLPWYCYTSDGGHSIVCGLKKYVSPDASPIDYMLPVPVKSVLQGYEIRDGMIIVDLPYDSNLGLVTPSEDTEF